MIKKAGGENLRKTTTKPNRAPPAMNEIKNIEKSISAFLFINILIIKKTPYFAA